MTLQIDGIGIKFGSFTLGPVSLSAGAEIVAVLGPNGSGKTTLLRSVNGLLPAVSGNAIFQGEDLRSRSLESLRRCSYVPDGDEMLFPELTLGEFFAFFIYVRVRSFAEEPDDMRDRAYQYAERLALEPGGERIGDFSLGMRRKVQLITGLMTAPALLMVDEPQNGLDFVSSQEVRAILSELRDTGATVLMSNHDLDSVARIADSIVILNAGKIVARSAGRFESLDACEAFVTGHFSR